MRYKVAFDTNIIRSEESIENFLGGRPELEQFVKVSEIIIPDIVVAEIKKQKKQHLISKKDAFLANPFHILIKIDKNITKKFDIDKCLINIIKNEKIPFTTIYLKRQTALEDIRKICIDNKPPFELTSDKGFKDAYIYYTILDYLDENEGNIFFATSDERLSIAFSGNARVIVVKNFDEFQKYNTTYFREEYFINRLKETVSDEIKAADIDEIWLNTNENWVLRILGGDRYHYVEVDFYAHEIIDNCDYDFIKDVKNLVNSNSFKETHMSIETLNQYTKYFSDQDIKDIATAATENSQIYGISEDNDVKQFLLSIFEAKHQIIPEDIQEDFKKYYISSE